MKEITINIPLPAQSNAGHAIYALANVLRLIAAGADDPRSKGASAQELLFYSAQVTKQAPDIHPAAAALMDFLMKPIDGAPKRKARAKKGDHLKVV